jgi:small conductance mechanosensitive channel
VNLKVGAWLGCDFWSIYFDVIEAVKKRFDAEGITILFPQRDVYIYGHKKV